VTGDGASCAVSFWPNRSPECINSMSPPDAEEPAKAKKPLVACKYKDILLISHDVPVDGMSVCQFCLTFGRERMPSTQPARGRRRRSSPSLKPWTVKNFSRARIEEHCPLSHPKKFTAFQSAVANDQSAPAVRIVFSASKLDARFDRAREGGGDIFISYEVGSLLNSLYEKDYDFASDDPEVRCISALELEKVDSSDIDDN
jgi:hypothetical protein